LQHTEPGYRKLFDAWPAVRWFLFLSAGIIAWRAGIPAPPFWMLPLCCAALIALLLFKHAYGAVFRFGAVSLTLAVLGLSLGHFQHAAKQPARKLASFYGDTLIVSGALYDMRTTAAGRLQGRLQTDSIFFPRSGKQPFDVLLLADVQDGAGLQKRDTAGSFTVVLQPLPVHREESSFNYPQWLEDQGITHRARIITQTEGRTPPLVYRIRNSLFARIDHHFENDIRGLVKALLIGYKHEIPTELKSKYADSGLSHLMAVSGLHVGFVMLPFLALFKLIGTRGARKHLLMALMVLVLTAYTVLTGSAASVIRAAGMMILFTAGKLYQQRTSSANILAATAVIALLFRPQDLFNTGFQLSYAAVGSLMLFASRTSAFVPYNKRELWWVKALLIIPVSLIVQAALWPILAWYFEKVSVAGPLANVPALYLAPVVVLGSALTLLVDIISPTAAAIPAFVTAWSGRGINFVAELFGTTQVSSVSIPLHSPVMFAVWATVIGLTARLAHPVYRVRWAMLLLLAVAAQFMWSLPDKNKNPVLETVFFDVGQGDAALVITPDNKHLLIDTGGLRGFNAAAKSAILPWLKNRRIDTLHAIIITHDHLDHTAGLEAISQTVTVKTVFVPPDTRKDAFSKALGALRNKSLKNSNITIDTLLTGKEIALSPSVFTGVISPLPSFTTERDKNLTSIGLLLAYGKSRYLFTGDLPEEGERALRPYFESLLDVDVMKAAHHGSRYSADPEWLAETTPSIVVTSSAFENRYKHPHAEAIIRFRQQGASVFHTALHGTIRVLDAGNPSTIRVQPSK
jgi:competence protein ComEC